MEAFGKNPRLAPIDKIAGDLSYAKGKLFRIDVDGTRTEITKHPFLDLMKNPNPLVEFTASALWKLFQEYLLLKGEAYFVIERYSDGRNCGRYQSNGYSRPPIRVSPITPSGPPEG